MSENFEMYNDIALICYDSKGVPTDAKTRARVADSFVRAKEVEAAFVLCGEESGPVSISARSAGKINVELIMKKLGGGGSFDRAGGFVNATLEKTLELLRSAIDLTSKETQEQQIQQ
jgi:c-di-AMP phosphodiesterase-like protein